jgi:hypothetical protein
MTGNLYAVAGAYLLRRLAPGEGDPADFVR